ncbi:hypothetical protein ACTJNA_02010 [Klebsiella pneumoniae]
MLPGPASVLVTRPRYGVGGEKTADDVLVGRESRQNHGARLRAKTLFTSLPQAAFSAPPAVAGGVPDGGPGSPRWRRQRGDATTGMRPSRDLSVRFRCAATARRRCVEVQRRHWRPASIFSPAGRLGIVGRKR